MAHHFGPYRLVTPAGPLYRGDRIVTIAPRTLAVLLLLVENADRVVTKKELIEIVWDNSYIEETSIFKNIAVLRKLLAEGFGEVDPIRTVSKHGYQFTVPVRKVETDTADAEPRNVAIPETTDRDNLIPISGGRRAGQTQAGILAGPALLSGNNALAQSVPAQPAPVEVPPVQTHEARRSPIWPILIGVAGVLVAAIFGAIAWSSVRGRFMHGESKTAPLAQTIPLTSYPGEQDRARLSPDGKQVVFLWKKENESYHDIYVQIAGAEPPLRLTNDHADKLNAGWSPDGRYIGFLRRSGSADEICVMPALGGSERKLGRSQVNASGLDWSPDGKWLAFVDSAPTEPNSIFLLSTQSGEKRKLTSPPRGAADSEPAFSPDGQNVAFLRSFDPTGLDVFAVPAAGGQPRRLTSDKCQIYGLTWSANGREIVFSSVRAGPPTLWRLPLETPEELQRVGIGAHAAYPSIARQGQRLAFTERFTDSNIWRMENPQASHGGRRSAPVKLVASTREDDSPQFSPDGGRIVFVSKRSGSDEIWRCDSNGSNLVQLTSFGGKGAGTPRWSPDGRQIAFDSRPFGAGDIFVMSAEGGSPQRLTTESSHDVIPSWSRDGRWIYFCSDRGGNYQIWKAPTEGGQAMQVTRKGGFEAFESVGGSFLYYTKGRMPGIWRVALKEGTPIGEESMVPQLREAGLWRYWAVTKEGVFFLPEEHTSAYAIRFFDFRTGHVTPIAALDRDPVAGPPGLDVSPDGRWILYAQIDNRISNIMLVEGFR